MHRFLLVPFAALALAACQDKGTPEPPAGVISREKFIAANVAVRTLPDTAPQARRDAALRKVGVTDRQLRAWVTAYSREPEALAKAWEEIAFKVDSIGGLPPGGAGAPPGQAAVELPRPVPNFTGDSMREPRRRPPPRRPPVDEPGDFNAPPAQ